VKSVVAWVLLGLVGLVLAGGAAVGIVHLTGQDAGLAGEPLDAGNDLIPTVVRTTTVVRPGTTAPRSSPVTPVTTTRPPGSPPVVAPPANRSDDGDGDHDGHRGRSGDDD